MQVRLIGTATLLAFLFVPAALAASHNDTVEWGGVSHLPKYDRQPTCPIDGEAFTIEFQTYRYDITDASVYVYDGSGQWVDAYWSHAEGPYDVWKADLPSTSSTTYSYYIALIDGSDTDYLGASGMSDGMPGTWFDLNYSTYSHAPLGCTLTSDGGAVFRVWGEGALNASVAGTFNGWNSSASPMTKNGNYFTRHETSTVYSTSMYKYVFNGSTWNPDARGRRFNTSDNYNTYAMNHNLYIWGDESFEMPAFEDLIIYQLHVGTFSGRNDGGPTPGTYRDVARRHIQHLVELGVNCVQLMPVTEFPWDYSGGYNPISQYAVESAYGTPDNFKYMVNLLHQNGIAVTIDIIWNHFSGSDNFLWDYTGSQIYFDDPPFETWWGAQADFDRSEVRDYFADSALSWMEEYHIDGFRMDATDFMTSPNGQASGWGLMQRFNNEMDNRAVHKISIAEQLPDDYYVTRPTSQGGAGFDAQYHDKYKYAMRDAILDAGYGNPNLAELRNCIMGDMNDGYNIVSAGQSLSKLYRYFELHDECWAGENGRSRLVTQIDTSFPHDDEYARGRTLWGNAVNMFIPGIPAFHQGTEFLEDTPFGADAPDTYEAQIDWDKPDQYPEYLQAFRDMILVRKSNPALRGNAGCEINHLNDSQDVMTIHRWDGSGNDILIVASLNNSDLNNYHIGFPQGGRWYEIYNTQCACYGGNGSGNGGFIDTSAGSYDGYSQSAYITVPRIGVLVFRYNDPPEGWGNGDLDEDGDVDLRDFALYQACAVPGGGCTSDADFNNDGVVDTADMLILQGNFTGPEAD